MGPLPGPPSPETLITPVPPHAVPDPHPAFRGPGGLSGPLPSPTQSVRALGTQSAGRARCLQLWRPPCATLCASLDRATRTCPLGEWGPGGQRLKLLPPQEIRWERRSPPPQAWWGKMAGRGLAAGGLWQDSRALLSPAPCVTAGLVTRVTHSFCNLKMPNKSQ